MDNTNTGILFDKKTVGTWLSEVKYGDDTKYIPSAFSLNFINMIKLINGSEGEENITPVLHLRMLDQVASNASRILNMVFRGAAKTTLFGEYLFFYIALYGSLPGFGDINLAIYVSDSVDNGVKNMRKNLEYRWENSDFLKEWLPERKLTDIRWEFTNKGGKKFVIKGYGAKTGVRGTKEFGTRPQLAVLDDLVSDEDARSPVVIKSIEDTVYKAVDFALHPKRNKIIWSGTPFNAGDPLYKAVETGTWEVNVFPVCERFPVERKDFKGAWEDRFTYDYVYKKYVQALESGKVSDFNQELMLQIMSDDDRLVLDNEINWYNRVGLLRNISGYNIYITTDFATSDKNTADYSVIIVWALNHIGQWFLVEAVVKRQTIDKSINDLFRFAQIYMPISVGIEISGQQGGFIPYLQSEMMHRNIFFSLASNNNSNSPGIRPSTNKYQRFQVALPLFKTGKIWFPIDMQGTPEMEEILIEIKQAAVGGFRSVHDDVLDNVSMLPLLGAWTPSQGVNYVVNKDGIWEVDTDITDNSASYYV